MSTIEMLEEQQGYKDVTLQLTKDQIEFLETHSNVMCHDGEKYYFMPFWFERDENEDLFKVHRLGYLPKKITSFIEMMRNDRGDEVKMSQPLTEKDYFKKEE